MNTNDMTLSTSYCEFDIKGALNQGKNIMVVGLRGVGKSYLVCDLLRQGQYYIGTVLTHASTNQLDLPPGICFCYSEDIIERDTIITNHLLNSYSVQDKPTVLVLDDCIYDTKSFTKPMTEAFAKGTNKGTNNKGTNHTTIMAIQYPLSIDPSLPVDYVFIFNESVKSNRQRLWKQYGTLFPTYDSFSLALDQVTGGIGNYSAMVIDCRTHDTPKEITELVFRYKAPENP
jgi:hypothetical protein